MRVVTVHDVLQQQLHTLVVAKILDGTLAWIPFRRKFVMARFFRPHCPFAGVDAYVSMTFTTDSSAAWPSQHHSCHADRRERSQYPGPAGTGQRAHLHTEEWNDYTRQDGAVDRL